jgi:peptide-methionine (S)-S-oxide reductase
VTALSGLADAFGASIGTLAIALRRMRPRSKFEAPGSAIFPTSPEQAKVAEAYIAQLNRAKVFAVPVVTTVEPNHTFYPAESYHQDFLARNPAYPYIAINDLPKVDGLKRLFPESYRSDPVLVSAAPSN